MHNITNPTRNIVSSGAEATLVAGFFHKPGMLLLCITIIVIMLAVGFGIARGSATHFSRLVRANDIRIDKLNYPTNVFVDRIKGEIYVGNRDELFIVNEEGFLLTTINLGKEFNAYRVVVDSKGIIYVINRKKWNISKFDQFGKKLGLMEIDDFIANGNKNDENKKKLVIRSMAIDEKDNLYLLDIASNSCLISDTEGRITGVVGREELDGYIDIDVSYEGKMLAFINYKKGHVKIYDIEGTLFSEFGRLGGGPGTFSQPVAIAFSPDDRVYALDRNRQTILIFNPEGQFLTEFGGLGLFYFPNDIFVTTSNKIFVADSMNNRIQRLVVELFEGR